MEFWLGHWRVVDTHGKQVGTNHVARTLDHIVLEHWTGADGSRGEGFFWHEPSTDLWQQVWVSAGSHKLKTLVERSDVHMRFQGIVHANGVCYPDRTTLTARRDGTVRQVIEHSRDGGLTWETGFDAIYLPEG
jgi:hypothetical protein